MFTGIIEEVGRIEKVVSGQKSSRIRVRAKKVLEDTILGDSIAVCGVCLTVTQLDREWFDADVMAETMRRTKLGDFKPGSLVNLERALQLKSRLGGHMVSGHIDGVGTIRSMEKEENAVWLTISASQSLLRYIIEKGSVAIDGASLTVAYVDDFLFKVSIIPHTADQTTLLRLKIGEKVNLECDIIGKYVEKLLGLSVASTEIGDKPVINKNFLIENGFI